MAFMNFATGEVRCKIVYYGPARSGKTTNLKYIHSRIRRDIVGKMTCIDTQGDQTIFFDFLPLELGTVGGLNLRIQLYTVPGQPYHHATRKLVLEGVDGIVFVADSLRMQRKKNIASLQDLMQNLKEARVSLWDISFVLQYNKRDLESTAIPVLPLDVMERDLNAMIRAPAFPASAREGTGVFRTLRAISKQVAKDVGRRMSHHEASDPSVGVMKKGAIGLRRAGVLQPSV